MTSQHLWLSSYELGVPAEIDAQRVVPLVDYLTNTAVTHPDTPALSNKAPKEIAFMDAIAIFRAIQ